MFDALGFVEKMEDIIKSLEDNDEWTDEFMRICDNETSYNSIQENIEIVNDYAGGIFEAIELYEEHYGEYERPSHKSTFYSQLAFISLYDKFYELAEKMFEEKNNSDSDEE